MWDKLVQASLWTEEIAGLSSATEFLLGCKGRKYFKTMSMKKSATMLNANIFDAAGKKVWFGDVDVQNDGRVLLNLAEKYGPLYILYATDERIRGKTMSLQSMRQMAAVVVEGGNILCSRDFAVKSRIIKKC